MVKMRLLFNKILKKSLQKLRFFCEVATGYSHSAYYIFNIHKIIKEIYTIMNIYSTVNKTTKKASDLHSLFQLN
ncbi:hypothetical protein AQ487_15120 [Enterococcus faecalis]|nr:hypothetical protein AQ486_00070 [Enterococcus faecalis]KXF72265.1 hypothetical protein AQ487_15120 [Enterococcus faecalis]